MWKPVNMLISNAFGSKNRYSKVELLELSAMLKLSFLTQQSATAIFKIHLSNRFHSALWKISPIRSSTQSNGQEIILREHLLSLLTNFPTSIPTEKSFWQSWRNKISRILPLWRWNSKLWRDCTSQMKRNRMMCALNLQ